MGSLKGPRKCKWFWCCRFKPEDRSFNLSDDRYETLTKKSASYNEGCRSRSKDKVRRSFSRVLRESLSRKYGTRRSGKDVYRVSSDLSSRIEKVFNSLDDKKLSSSERSVTDGDGSDSSRSTSMFSLSTISASSSRSSSCSSSIASSSRTSSEREQSCPIDFKQPKISMPDSQKKKISGNSHLNSIIGLYLVLVCLVGVVFCGKAFAIFSTSSCLILFRGLFKRLRVQANEVGLLDIDSNEYKKKVIMEGQ